MPETITFETVPHKIGNADVKSNFSSTCKNQGQCVINRMRKQLDKPFVTHWRTLNAKKIITEAEKRFADIFGRKYMGLFETRRAEDADYIMAALGNISGFWREIADKLRLESKKKQALWGCAIWDRFRHMG